MKERGKWSIEAKEGKKIKMEEAKNIFKEAITETQIIIESLKIIYDNSSEDNRIIIGKAIDKLNMYIYDQDKNIVLKRCL